MKGIASSNENHHVQQNLEGVEGLPSKQGDLPLIHCGKRTGLYRRLTGPPGACGAPEPFTAPVRRKAEPMHVLSEDSEGDGVPPPGEEADGTRRCSKLNQSR